MQQTIKLAGSEKHWLVKCGINTLYDGTVSLYGDLYHLENLNRCPCAAHLGCLYKQVSAVI